MKPQWIKYNGSDEQIAELNNCKNGLLAKNYLGYIWPDIYEHFDFAPIGATHYLICDPHPYADMICRQARTGQPVWVRMKSSTYWIIAMRGFDLIYQDHVVSVIKSNTPDWNIPNAEYSFTEFKEEL